MKTVLVLGASYGGARAARVLADSLPDDWRVVVLERNSHMNRECARGPALPPMPAPGPAPRAESTGRGPRRPRTEAASKQASSADRSADVYVFPRLVVLPEHAPKGFVPYDRMFAAPAAAPDAETEGAAANGGPAPSRHVVLQGLVTAISAHSVTYLSPAPSYDGVADDGRALARAAPSSSSSSSPPPGEDGEADEDGRGVVAHELAFDYLIYALGAGLPGPCDVWGEVPAAPSAGRGSKRGGVAWMRARHAALAAGASVAVVGGGALGIQYAADIKAAWPHKAVTLVHSRDTLMPLYPGLHAAAAARLAALGVTLVLGERVVQWPDEGAGTGAGVKHITTASGRTVAADVVLACTGQRPRTHLLRTLADVDPASGRIRVRPSMQVEPRARPAEDEGANGDLAHRMGALSVAGQGLDHVFAIGDCAHTAAIQAGHTAYYQGEVAARNVLRLIGRSSPSESGAKDAKAANGAARPKTDGSEDVAAKLSAPASTMAADELETYTPGPPAIKLTLGLKHYATHLAGELAEGADGVADLGARLMWGPLNAEALPDDA